MKRWLVTLILLLTSIAQAADIVIKGPTTPVKPGRSAILWITGLSAGELAQAIAEVEPNDEVVLQPAYSWGGLPFLVFTAENPGKYRVTVTVNPAHAAWRAHLDEALVGAIAANINSELLAEFQSVASQAAETYPANSGSTVLEVAGYVPPPKPDPPIPVTVGTVWTLVIRTTDTLTADQSQTLSDLRQWSDQQPANKVAHLEFAPDAVGPGGERDAKVAAFVAKIPAGKTQPYIFISQPITNGRNLILWQGELPKTADEIIARIKQHVSM